MTDRVAIYARYSTDNQRETSIEDQLRVCRQRAERAGWEVVAEFTDAAFSGTNDRRPGFQALRDAMRRRQFDRILVENTDRLARDAELGIRFRKEAAFCRVKVATLSRDEVPPLESDISSIIDAHVVRSAAEKTLRGLTGRLLGGHSISMPSYGYRVVRRIGADGEVVRGLREIVPEHARIMRVSSRSTWPGAVRSQSPAA